MYYSPLRYPGGKNCIFNFVSDFFYENNLIGCNYAEPYAGGSGLALRLLFEGYVEKIYINDLDRSIYSFWKAVLNDTEKFCEWINRVEVSIDNWEKYRKTQSQTINYFELAKSTFYLNRTNVSGILKGGVIGGIKQKGKYKIDARFNKRDLINRIKKIATLKDRIVLSNDDGMKFINKIDKKKENIFIYLDPPYVVKGADLYMNFCSIRDHENLAKSVNRIKNKWMVSYDNSSFIINLYAEKNKISYKLSQSASNRVGDEILIIKDGLILDNSRMQLNSAVNI